MQIYASMYVLAYRILTYRPRSWNAVNNKKIAIHPTTSRSATSDCEKSTNDVFASL